MAQPTASRSEYSSNQCGRHQAPELTAAAFHTSGSSLGWHVSCPCSSLAHLHGTELLRMAADNGTAGADLGDEELDVAAWGEPELNLDAEGHEANGFDDEDGLAEPGADGDEEGGWDMEVS